MQALLDPNFSSGSVGGAAGFSNDPPSPNAKAPLSPFKAKSGGDQLEEHGVELHRVEGDGNCMFRAVADVMEHDESQHRKYRKEAIHFIKEHKDYFQMFLENDESINNYLHEMKKDGKWGSYFELVALSQALNVDFCIHTRNDPPYVVSSLDRLDGPTNRPLKHLMYYSDAHYDSTKPLTVSPNKPPKSPNKVPQFSSPNTQTQQTTINHPAPMLNPPPVQNKTTVTQPPPSVQQINHTVPTNGYSKPTNYPYALNHGGHINQQTQVAQPVTVSKPQPQGITQQQYVNIPPQVINQLPQSTPVSHSTNSSNSSQMINPSFLTNPAFGTKPSIQSLLNSMPHFMKSNKGLGFPAFGNTPILTSYPAQLTKPHH
jgi:hypothetical protein